MESNSATRRRNSSSSFEDSRDFDQILAEMGVFHAGFELNEDNSDIDGSIPTIGRGLGYNDETWIENDGHSKRRSIVKTSAIFIAFLVFLIIFSYQTARFESKQAEMLANLTQRYDRLLGIVEKLRQDFGKIHAGIDRSAKNERKVELLDVVNYLKSFLLV